MNRRLLSFCLSILVLFSMLCLNVPEIVSADGENQAYVDALKTYLGHDPSEAEKYQYSLIITTCKADGISVIGIAGILGNMAHESGGNEYTVEGYYGGKKTVQGVDYTQFQAGKSYDYGSTEPYWMKSGAGGVGLGLVQWSHGRAEALDKLATSNGGKYSYVTVKHWIKCGAKDCHSSFCPHTKTTRTAHIPNRAGQAAFMCQELNSGYSSVKSRLNSATTPSDAADIFLDNYEIPSNKDATRSARRTSATNVLPVVEACTGLTGSSDQPGGSNGNSDAENIAADMIAKGYWTEDQLSAYCKLCEINIQSEYLESARRENLDQSSLGGLSNWERNVRNNAKEDGFIAKLRIATMWLGIMFTVWVALIYIAYWFDRLNSLFYIDMLSILTFGKLHISDTEDECTFHLNTLGKTDKKTVNHKTILGICLTGLLFASLIITGAFYKIIAGFVNFVLRILN